ncbi:MAG: Ribonucleoside-triphosphate reductase [Candidatus Nomurabacteria bacterium GW2011_GWE1_32_28]|uniref:Ribonucleoside-triphosphate reductase n=1 Tax=Candidatus Nomurabacteria bacterium GW2011_GWF1_31_48 TaxID=1618767 RepID=A0A0G0AU89_9BACT|nr:MAG: Ribonucleoside-triphosphate reductase [Candidatus Nomurabacteria bacterium GW2011_GWF2_30_133]KKP28594.1 MAG: Ribonucleoside-triphosphate reductase [Candidatus Nomurabacteria bacterium GW2011_GWE2_31_40]KKP30170.1 MAG: Ribonucleoside-triphosphate reductase [Candidatus Nomurabacteria bacterium GW2011_GWF1_31_48]KKP34696.1 MAG: Ribonucleoside-triphosphate reductase [Candidatus Nomurabacteria bacterium GW2011_GWE1_32_28]HAS80845.1 ribonucleoside-triphosphate reductase [Candidatus Nomurabac
MEKDFILGKEELIKIKNIRNREGEIIPFNINKIADAVYKAFLITNEGEKKEAKDVATKVFHKLVNLKIKSKEKKFIPTVEIIQDLVEAELMDLGYHSTAKSYILYRSKRAELRREVGTVPPENKKVFDESSSYFVSSYEEFIFYRTYSKWQDGLGRRETWVETIDRFMIYMKENLGNKLSSRDYSDVREGILNQEICPSMRLLWSAGEACKKTNVWAYNCSYIAPSAWQDLGETMYILMCGAGLGFSIESETVQKFPQIRRQTGKKLATHFVEDSKEGWADAYVLGCKTWADGYDIDFDYSKVRPSGARLKIAGGRASGPQPLIDLMNFTKKKILARQAKRLTNLDLHDIICQIGLIVVAGGVRRSALISLSDIDDESMRKSKQGQFWIDNGQRSMANNSAVYNQKPSASEFLNEWLELIKSGTGERGIFNRGGLMTQLPKRRIENWKEAGIIDDQNVIVGLPGSNPCGEITLRSKQFCNLTSIVVRPKDSIEDLKRKVRLSTILGTYQATLTHFGYLSKEWKNNCDDEALLGVSITGYYDNQIIRSDDVLSKLREESIKTNREYAKKFGIKYSTCITTIKPHGNSGQLLYVGSGMHPWYAEYYIRRVRISTNDPLFQLIKDQGVPFKAEVGYSTSNSTVAVVEFPIKAPEGAITRDKVSAIDLLNEWKRLKVNYIEHNPSVTIYVGEDEWIKVANFVYENWDIVGGLSFLPRSEHVYQLAPYEEISKEEYNRRIKEIKHIDFSKLIYYEQEDNTVGAKEFACVSGVCSVDDVLAEEAQKEKMEDPLDK